MGKLRRERLFRTGKKGEGRPGGKECIRHDRIGERDSMKGEEEKGGKGKDQEKGARGRGKNRWEGV